MKKTTLAFGIIAILGIGYVGTAWYTGNIIESNIDNKLEEITAQVNHYQNEYNIAIKQNNLEKNIFSTKMHLIVTLSPRDSYDTDSLPNKLFDDDIIIHHGPFPMAALAKGVFSPQMAWIEYQMSEQAAPDLWKLLGNKPFISGHAAISYQNYVQAKVTNQALSATPTDLKDLNGIFTISEGDFTFESDKDFVNLQVDARLDKLNYIETDDSTLSFDDSIASTNNNSFSLNNLTISTKPNKEKAMIDFDVYIGNLHIKDDIDSYSQLDTSVDNFKLNGSINSKNNDLEVQNSIDKLIFKLNENRQTLPIEFNKLSLNQKNTLNKADTVDGLFRVNVDSVIYGQQNLGSGIVDFAFQGLDKKLFDYYDLYGDIDDQTNHFEVSNSNFSLNTFNWHNVVGDINISSNAKMIDSNKIPDTSYFLNFENYENLNLKLEIPFDVLAYMAVQTEAAENNESNVSQEQIDNVKQLIRMNTQMLLSNVKILTFKKGNTDGIFSDVEYTKENDIIKVNGEKMLRQELLNGF
ncbi:DUF945 family protein [uncultured Gilliamella sp.]|uniref:DUF945 family protein n=1 Tax=uncultured Gilliamella sp. TaxID=1193505 RepID=UPI0025F18F17|nr:DUF945 family protein [uncultured Gilliamella sp.]